LRPEISFITNQSWTSTLPVVNVKESVLVYQWVFLHRMRMMFDLHIGPISHIYCKVSEHHNSGGPFCSCNMLTTNELWSYEQVSALAEQLSIWDQGRSEDLVEVGGIAVMVPWPRNYAHNPMFLNALRTAQPLSNDLPWVLLLLTLSLIEAVVIKGAVFESRQLRCKWKTCRRYLGKLVLYIDLSCKPPYGYPLEKTVIEEVK